MRKAPARALTPRPPLPTPPSLPHRERGRKSLALLFLIVASMLACTRGPRGADAPAAPEEPKAPPKILAIRAPEDLLATLKQEGFFRWAASRFEGLRFEIGPEAAGDAMVWVDRLPASPEVASRLQGLPVDLSAEVLAFAGTRYPSGEAMALRLPTAEKPSWIVLGRDEEGIVSLASDILFRLAFTLTGEGRGRRSRPFDFDYVLQESPWMMRSGYWVRNADGGWTVDPSAERDDFAEWDRAFAAMVPIPGERVSLLVSPGDRQRPELIRLAAELDRAAAGMARHLSAPAGR